MTRWNQLLTVATLATLTVVSTSPANAQIGATTGAIVGTVADNTKAVMPGVTVTARAPSLMGVRTVVTESDGTYRIPALPPGVYSLRFDLSGFNSVTRDGIQVGLGFTATINVEMGVGGLSESVTVSGASPVVDITTTAVSTNYGAEKLESLAGSRDYAAVTSYLPGVIMSRPSVGGTGAVTYQRSTRYGLVGHDRGEIEGINSTEAAAGGQEVAYSDSDSFDDMNLSVVGNGADMPNPGTHTKVISKSGSNRYHGRVYFDYQDDALETYNIDEKQIALGLTAPGTVGLRDGNRLISFRDYSADLGGYLLKDRVWWYGAYRKQRLQQYQLNLLDDTHILSLEVKTLKVDARVTENSRFSWYWFYGTKRQNHSILANLGDTAITTADALQTQKWPNGVWKVEYNGVLGDSAAFEIRGGNFFERGIYDGVGTQPRYMDTGSNRNYGNAGWSRSNNHRPQVNGVLNYVKDGWFGSHNFKIGGEFIKSLVWGTDGAYQNLTMILNNSAPSQVRVFDAPRDSSEKRGNIGWGAHVQDSWRVNSRMTFNIGLRVDRQLSYVPEQIGPTGQRFDRIESPEWINWAPRVGGVFDLTGKGRTVMKVNYGQYWTYAYVAIATLMNPLPAQSSRLYAWTPASPRIVNGFPVYDPGQEGALLSVSGARADGRPATRVDPNLKNEYSRQALAFIEHELAADWGVRTGFVWNGLRQGRATVNANQPFDGFNVPIAIADPGPDGRLGTSDDAGSIDAWNLNPAYIGLPPDQFYTNVPHANSDHYTWEAQTSRRMKNNWSLQTSFTYTWQRLGVMQSAPYLEAPTFTPNSLISSKDNRHRFGIWGAKAELNMQTWKGIRLSPSLRHQSGPPFARTFLQRLNYNSAVLIRAEPVGAQRMDHIWLLDLRVAKDVTLPKSAKIGMFFDVYNLFNRNTTQELVRSSGPTYLRPSVITSPRVARVGLKFNF
jgi:hypothetical protein